MAEESESQIMEEHNAPQIAEVKSASPLCHTSDLVQIIIDKHPNKDYYLDLLIRRMNKAFNDPPPSPPRRTIPAFPRKISKSSIMMEWNVCKESTIVKCVLLVAIILESLEVISHKFKDECWDLLQAMYKLAVSFHRLKDYPILFQLHQLIEKNAEANPGLCTIVDASFACFVHKIDKRCGQHVLNPFTYSKDIKKYRGLVNEAQTDLGTQMLVYILHSRQPRFLGLGGDETTETAFLKRESGEEVRESTDQAQVAEEEIRKEIAQSTKQVPLVPEAEIQEQIAQSTNQAETHEVQGTNEDTEAARQEEKHEEEITEGEIDNVIKHLLLGKSKKKQVAVVIQGDSKETSTNLAKGVYDHLEVQLLFRGWKLCRQMIPENEEFNPNVEELHSYIVTQLVPRKEEKTRKKSRIVYERVFICIENILRAQDLRKILDMELMRRMNFRLLITSANKNVKALLEGELFDCEVHDTRVSRIMNDKENVDLVLLEMIEYYNRSYKAQDEGNVRESTQLVVEGDLMETAFNFALQIAFLNLPATARESFVHICSFYLGRHWREVSLISGKAQFEILEQDGWVKGNCYDQITVPAVLLELGRLRANGRILTTRNELKNALSSVETTNKITGIWLHNETEEPADNIPDINKLRVLSLGISSTVQNKSIESFKKLRFLQVQKTTGVFQANILNQLSNLKYFECNKDLQLTPSQLPPGLRILKLRGDARLKYYSRNEWIKWELPKLRILRLENFENSGIEDFRLLRPFDQLKELSIVRSSVVELPESLTKLHVLEKLDLHDCKYLRKLPESFGSLVYLSELNLSYCSSLRRLPKSFGELQSLKDLVLSYCSAIKHLPPSFVWLGNLKKATFTNCHNIYRLPDKFELLTSLEEVDFSFCSNLKLLPTNFHLLCSLYLLNLQGCSKLEKLPYSYPESLFMSNSAAVKLSGSSSLSDLPKEFCEGNQLEDLSLAYCTNLYKLPSHVSELGRLRRLNLSYCINLYRLPQEFKRLTCLEVLNLSSCSKLRSLCDGFSALKGLKDINLSYCPFLKSKWIKTIQKMKRLRVVDVRGTPQFDTGRRYHFTLLSDAPEQDIPHNEDIVQKLLDGAATIFFKDKPCLIDLYGRPFVPCKQISVDTTLAFIFDHNISRWDWEVLEKNVDQLLTILLKMKIIYVGKSLSAVPGKLLERLTAYTPENSEVLSLFDKTLSIFGAKSSDFWEFSTCIVKTKVVKDAKGLKHFQDWESISHLLIGRDYDIQKYRSLENMFAQKVTSDSQHLKVLLMTKKGEELSMTKLEKGSAGGECNKAKIRKEVTIDDLQLGTVFLLVSTLEISQGQISFLNEMYKEMQKMQKLHMSCSWIWVPVAIPPKSESKYQEIKDNMPWVVIENPYVIEQSMLSHFFRERFGFCGTPILLSLAIGSYISTTDVSPMVATLGSEALLFLNDKGYKLPDILNKLHFYLPPHFKEFHEKSNNCQLVWLCGGDPIKIGAFSEKLTSVTEMLGNKILYVGRERSLHHSNSRAEEPGLYKNYSTAFTEWNTKGKEGSAPKNDNSLFYRLSYWDMRGFWHHLHYLVYLKARGLNCRQEFHEEQEHGANSQPELPEEVKKKIESIQRLVLALLSLDCVSRRNGTVWMMAIDYSSNKILTAKGKDLVEIVASNIHEKSKKSLVKIANGVVEVITKKKTEEGPSIELQMNSMKFGEERNCEEKKRFEDPLWLTAHPSSQIEEQISAPNRCSMCYNEHPAYECDYCGCFSICQQCYIKHFIGRRKGTQGKREEISIAIGQQ